MQLRQHLGRATFEITPEINTEYRPRVLEHRQQLCVQVASLQLRTKSEYLSDNHVRFRNGILFKNPSETQC